MTETNDLGLRKIRRALISVSDKTGIVDFARELENFDVEIISTGGTAKALRDAGLDVRDVSDVTGFPEMMDGRIKTLHPKIHGALLGLRDKTEHIDAMRKHEIEPIDMVVINLYPFEQTISREGVSEAEAIEQIDIGGPAMIRSAAKNAKDVVAVVRPEEYPYVITELHEHDGAISLATRKVLAKTAFSCTAMYDVIISAYLDGAFPPRNPESQNTGIAGSSGGSFTSSFGMNSRGEVVRPPQPVDIDSDDPSIETYYDALPISAQWSIAKVTDLRYGENPHQIAALYKTKTRGGIANAELLSGKEMSFNNYVDADAAWQLVFDFEERACAIIKHTNPAGVGLAPTAEGADRSSR